MSDFLLDFRPREARSLALAAEALRFVVGTRNATYDLPSFGLALTQTGDPSLWSPYCAASGSLVAVAGRPVFEESDWKAAEEVRGAGGLASKAIYRQVFETIGLSALERLNGNYAVLVYDHERRRVHLVTDSCGVFPVFGTTCAELPVYGSHPDVLAEAAGVAHALDETSLAEFVLTRTVTPPFTYYQRVRALESGCIYTFDLDGASTQPIRRRHFDFAFHGQPGVDEADLAQQLAGAVRKAVQRRTLPRLGRSAVALSGGLDSRVILANSLGREHGLAFTCYDEPNQEFKTAEAIATALSAPFRGFRRSADYYADHAELGVRISGGMGTFANNHFLGIIPQLQAEGIENLLTGCYCDYLFKALPLNLRSHWLTRRETLGPFRHEFYFHHYPGPTPLGECARQRWESRVPAALQNSADTAAVFAIEARRSFPLSYEGDNQQRLVPQRVTGWCPPFIDRDLMEIYCRLPYHFKLNRSIFRKVVLAVAPEVRAIPDANTGASVDASAAWEWLQTSRMRIRRQWRSRQSSVATDESWPNWFAYAPYSRKLDALWRRPNPDAIGFFRQVLGPANLPDDVEVFKRERPFLFVGLLSLKLWLDQRLS